ncbi:Serine--tRNA ligase, mitochondrial, partial [Ascosphaera atra]
MSQGRASLKEFLWPGCNRVAQRLCARPARRAFATTASARSNSDDGPIRPPMAPKPVLNTRHIKENVETYSKNCIDRNYGALAGNPAEIKRLLEESTSLQQTLNAPRAKTKQVEKTIAQLMRASKEETESSAQANELEALRQEAQRLKKDSQDMMAQREKNMEEIQRLALSLPNLTAPETPIGDDPRLVQYINFDPQNPPSY